MSKLRYSWLKQPRDYYRDETIKWLTLQEHGNDLVVLYQKLCLLCLDKQTDVLRITVGEIDVPYTANDFSKEFLMDSILIEKGLYVLEKMHLIKTLENGSLYIPKFKKMVGSESRESEAKREHRRELARLRKRKQREREKLAIATSKTQALLTDGREKK